MDCEVGYGRQQYVTFAASSPETPPVKEGLTLSGAQTPLATLREVRTNDFVLAAKEKQADWAPDIGPMFSV